MDKKSLNKLEYQSVLKLIENFAVSVTAKEKIANLLPAFDVAEINKLLNETNEALQLINYNVYPVFNFDDVTECAQKAKILSVLSFREALSVMRLLRTSRLSHNTLFNAPVDNLVYLADIANGLYFNKQLEDSIDAAILNDDEMADNASAELFDIRQKIKRANADIKEKLNDITKSSTMSKYLQDSIVTLRNNRYVLPVKTEYKNNIQGLIHDQSASGSTLFIEPVGVVNLNNKLKELLLAERAEINRIMADFTQKIGLISDLLLKNQNIIAYIDSVYAKALFGIKYKCVLPQINTKGVLQIHNGRHPLLNQSKAVPLNIKSDRQNRQIIVTGPNTGGKTVALKTIGLLCLMSYSGIFIPADEDTKINLYDDVFCDIGDEQSIQQNLSTFSSHIKNINDIIKKATANSLVLLDELGAGTEPIEGSAIALAVCEYLLNLGAQSIITTHFGKIKEYSITTAGVMCAGMEFDPQTFEPTYRLIMGVPCSSNAIEIAKRLGLPQSIIDTALANVSQDKKDFDAVIINAEKLRRNYEDQIENLKQMREQTQIELQKAKNQNKLLQQERDKLLTNSKTEAKRIVSNAKIEAEELIGQLKGIIKAQNLQEKPLFEARSIIKKLDSQKYDVENKEDTFFEGQPIDLSTLKIGDKVYVKRLKTVAVVCDIGKHGKVTVKFNNITAQIKQGEAYSFVDTAENTTIKKQTVPLTKLRTGTFSYEINLIGQTTDEGIANLDKYLDEAVMRGAEEIRVIHGRGTGKLKNAVHAYLKTNKNVKEYRLGAYNEGDGGVTILKLK